MKRSMKISALLSVACLTTYSVALADGSEFTIRCSQKYQQREVYLDQQISVENIPKDDFVITVDPDRMVWWAVSRNGKTKDFISRLAQIDSDLITLSRNSVVDYEKIDRQTGRFYSTSKVDQGESRPDGTYKGYIQSTITGDCVRATLQPIPSNLKFRNQHQF